MSLPELAADAPAARLDPAASAQPIRVALVGPSLDILGGQAVQLERLRRRFEGDPNVIAELLAVNPRLPPGLSELQRVKYVRTIVTSIAYFASLLWRVRRYDVVHAFSASYWSFLLAPLPAMIVGRLFGKAVLLNYRSGEAADHLAKWRWLVVPAMRLADEIVVPSGYLVGVFAKFGLQARSIFNFVDIEQLPYRERSKLRPIFLCNRNFQSLYNVACTIRAFARIQAEVPEARLIVAGFGPERQALESLVGSLGLRHVDFRGRVQPVDMLSLYDEADVYLNSPNVDNMPTSVIEAFAAGLPVVTTDAGGIPFIVTHEKTGLMVARDDDAAIASAALRLLREPGLGAGLASAARQECLAQYVWPAVRSQWQTVYRDLAGGT